jgi:Protein of unknown function (DUF4089)
MPGMNDAAIAAYVDAACKAQGIILSAREREQVIAQFTRIATIAAPVLDLELGPEVEMAPVFRP